MKDTFSILANEYCTMLLDNVLPFWLDHGFDCEYGYLHHNNTLSTPLKGNMYKGPFHIPRMYLVCSSLLNELSQVE